MVQVARLAPKILGEATPLVVDFLQTQRHPDGGFRDRAGQSDPYYTVFGIESLLALQQPLPTEELRRYARSFDDGRQLDLIQIACLARIWSALPAVLQVECPRNTLLAGLESHRTHDGGFGTQPGMKHGSMYGTFMSVGAYQDLRDDIPQTSRLLDFVDSLAGSQGAYRQSQDLPVELVPATAGAVALLRHFGQRPVAASTGQWMLSCFDPQGGFRAAPHVPMPDLLSTATALHALTAMKIDLGERRESCLDFVDSLWTNRGGFFGHWDDSHVDCEYTYYALLALGHLSL
jgi:hypothetical protein